MLYFINPDTTEDRYRVGGFVGITVGVCVLSKVWELKSQCPIPLQLNSSI